MGKYSNSISQDWMQYRQFAKYWCYSTIYSDASREAFKDWTKHDDAQDNFCELDGKLNIKNALLC